MSWMAKLYETYEAGIGLQLSDSEKLMPISHTIQNAHINIVIDGEGSFKRASILEKTQIVLPATEKSASRSSGEAPHPLADKIQYVAKDYKSYCNHGKEYFESYRKQLKEWCNSKNSHPKAVSIYNYINRGSVVADLVEVKILHLDDENQLRIDWPFAASIEKPIPDIFKILPKKKDKLSGKSFTDQGSALVCWTVEIEGDMEADTWTDNSLQDAWIQFDAMEGGSSGLCFVTGEEKILAKNHPAKLRHTGDKAKLISSNDMSGFTFRGRFTDTKKSIPCRGSQSVGIGFEVTQKAHNALRWLISRQGYRNDDQVYVSWAVSGKSVPGPLDGFLPSIFNTDLLRREPIEIQHEHKDSEKNIDFKRDLGESFAHQLKKYIAGYGTKLQPNEQIIVLGLDSATPGRMSIIFYRELLASEFLKRLEDWHSDFAWPQRHTKEIQSGKNSRKVTFWPVSSPVPRNIADAAYGTVLKSNKTLKKSLLERIIPCIVDGRQFPRDVMIAAIRRASNRNNCEKWEWERNLGIVCALYKGFYVRHPDKTKRRKYSMALEQDKNSRDYLYGRLLAIAERIEEIALNVGGERRPTTAARLMQRFADRPFSTWRNIELGLQPYMQRLQSSRAGFLVNRKKELDAVLSSFQPDEFTSEKPLSGEFLLAYHCQRLFFQTTQSNENKED